MGVNQLSETPASLRMHIAVFGRTNSGKSSVINAVTGQRVSLVSEVSGTTTDPVSKSMELYPLGPCVFIDTAGFNDETELGQLRTDRTREVLKKTDMAILLVSAEQTEYREEKLWLELIRERKIPVVGVLNKSDLIGDTKDMLEGLKQELGMPFVPVSAVSGSGIEQLKSKLVETAPRDFEQPSITGHLVREGDSVLLVMPQDIQAPKGRLILPQVQTIRDLLDQKAVVTSVTTDKMEAALAAFHNPPDLIITDSQVFSYIYERKPEASKLTSFSALMARYKGDIAVFAEGAQALDHLKETDRVLIAEACTHNPLDGDIGRVKIPNMLRKKVGQGLAIDIVNGSSFPEDLSPYALIVHCGGCMFNRRYMLDRVRSAKGQQVPITNYGILIAKASGILDKIIL